MTVIGNSVTIFSVCIISNNGNRIDLNFEPQLDMKEKTVSTQKSNRHAHTSSMHEFTHLHRLPAHLAGAPDLISCMVLILPEPWPLKLALIQLLAPAK